MNALKNLKCLAFPVSNGKQAVTTIKLPAHGKTQIPDCCICEYFFSFLIINPIKTDLYTGLFGVTIRQALFIAPCSHTFHYKCIRPLLESHHPAFSCPLCRTFADLEEDVEVEVEYEEESDDVDGAVDKDVTGECDMDIDVEEAFDDQVQGSGDRASPLADLTDEADEEMLIDFSKPAPPGGDVVVV